MSPIPRNTFNSRVLLSAIRTWIRKKLLKFYENVFKNYRRVIFLHFNNFFYPFSFLTRVFAPVKKTSAFALI